MADAQRLLGTLADADEALRAITTAAVWQIWGRSGDAAIDKLFARGVELRVLSSLWPLRDAVVASSLGFSIIRMRNAQPRDSFTTGA